MSEVSQTSSPASNPCASHGAVVDPTPVLGAVQAVVEILKPFAPTHRQHIVSAALHIFGETNPVKVATASTGPTASIPSGVSPKAEMWMKQHKIDRVVLEQTFLIDGGNVEVIAAQLPGKGPSNQTLEAYILTGLRGFLQTGELAFTDKEARELCVKLGCYSANHHAEYLRLFGNRVSGNKSAGWKLTNPGLVAAAEMIKQLCPEAAGK